MSKGRIKIEDENEEDLVPEDAGEIESAEDWADEEVVVGEVVEEEPDQVLAESLEAVEGEEEEVDELAALREQLDTVQAQADEYLDDLRRERAAFQNFKKRQVSEREELRQTAVASLLFQVLPVVDDLERALETIPEEQSEFPWVEGIVLIQRKLRTALDVVGVDLIGAEPGQPFDPFVHEAVTYEESKDRKEGEIIAVVQKGYKLGKRTLRPAMVRVAR